MTLHALGLALLASVLPGAAPAHDSFLPPSSGSALVQPWAAAQFTSAPGSARPDQRLVLRAQGLPLGLFLAPEREREAPWRTLFRGRYGPGRWLSTPELTWSSNSCEPGEFRFSRDAPANADDASAFPFGFDWDDPVAPATVGWWGGDATADRRIAWLESLRTTDCSPWQRPRSVTLARYGGETDRFRLLECDGSVNADSLDRLTLMARPPGVARPRLPLPLEPHASAARDAEWLPRVKLLHPRLVWLVQQVANAFPGATLYVISGYRPEASSSSYHHQGRALDLFVRDVPNERLFAFCRSLRNVGCGYYPNNHFVHLDVRPPNQPEAYWVDTSSPGERSVYVDSWPGVVDGGALRYAGSD